MSANINQSTHSEHHVIPPAMYLKVFLILIAFTIITVAFPPFLRFIGWEFLDAPIAFVIATAKATLVLMYFMHLKYDSVMNRVIFLSTIFFLALLLALSLLDIWTRVIPASSM